MTSDTKKGIISTVPILLALLGTAVSVVVWATGEHRLLEDRCRACIVQERGYGDAVYATRSEMSATIAELKMIKEALTRIERKLDKVN